MNPAKDLCLTTDCVTRRNCVAFSIEVSLDEATLYKQNQLMKKIITTVSLAAFGATGLQAAYAPDLSPTSASKIWSVSASLRGFYDDNYITAPTRARLNDGTKVGPEKRDSYGFEVSPSFNINIPLEQTFIGLGYTYRFVYFEDRDFKGNPEDPYDQGHQASLRLDHQFSERSKLELSDTFVISREPTIVEEGIPGLTRTESDILRNTAAATFSTDLSELFSIALGYTNNYYDYEQEAKDVGAGSRSALLDRITHLGSINLRWQARTTTVALVGYQYGRVNYTSEDPLTPLLAPGNPLNQPEVRDNYSHYIFVGADQQIASQVTASVRAGAQITVYDNLPSAFKDEQISPYADASLSYAYASGSSLQVGARHARNQTDIAYMLGSTSPTLDQETTTGYGSINHQITGKLKGSLLGQLQLAEFESGVVENKSDVFYLLGVNLTYQFNPHLAVEAGYNFDRLDSDISYGAGYPRSYSRNRLYIGIRGTL